MSEAATTEVVSTTNEQDKLDEQLESDLVAALKAVATIGDSFTSGPAHFTVKRDGAKIGRVSPKRIGAKRNGARYFIVEAFSDPKTTVDVKTSDEIPTAVANLAAANGKAPASKPKAKATTKPKATSAMTEIINAGVAEGTAQTEKLVKPDPKPVSKKRTPRRKATA